MVKRKGLGRGLDALLAGANHGNDPVEVIRAATEVAADPKLIEDGILKELPVEYMQRGKYQPRRDMGQEALEELSKSIKSQGVMQPIIVRPIGQKEGHTQYEIVAGERRWRATQLAGLDKIPAVIRDVPDETAIAMALIENIQREDLNPMEESVALKRLQDEFELTQQQVADAVGKSRTAVTNLLRLLNLNDEIRTMLEHGDLEMGHARCLLTLEPDQQRSVARQVVAKGLSVRQAEALARAAQKSDKGKENTKPSVTSDLKNLEEGLGEHIGVPVMVQHSAKGKGKLVLKYNSLDELDGILNHLGYSEEG